MISLGLVALALTMAALSGGASAQKVLDRYQVGRPALSHDGRLLAGIGLSLAGGALVLNVPAALQPVLGEAVETRLFRLARAFGLPHQIMVQDA